MKTIEFEYIHVYLTLRIPDFRRIFINCPKEIISLNNIYDVDDSLYYFDFDSFDQKLIFRL